MKQLIQKLKNGEMQILEVPLPVLRSEMVLVGDHYSLISAGTEGSNVTPARKNLVGKVKERPQQVDQVIDTLKRRLLQTFHKVTKKLGG